MLRRLLLALAMIAVLPAYAGEERRVVIHLVRASAGRPIAGALSIQSATGEETRLLAVAPDASATGVLPIGNRWIVSSSLAGWWMPPEMLLVERGAGPLDVQRRVWPTATIKGSVQWLPAKRTTPAVLAVSIEHPPGESSAAAPSGVIDCPIDRDGRFACEIPAGRIDLAFRARGYIPQYRWNVHLAAGSMRDIGVLTLRSGASVSGWIRAEDKKAKPAGARISIGRLVAGGGDARLTERLRRPVATTDVRADGFFQLGGIPAGTYSITAEQRGFAPSTVQPIEVYDGAETALRQPLVLRRPIHVRVLIEPPADLDGAAWRVSLVRSSDYTGAAKRAAAFEGSAARDGSVEAGGQAPGLFYVSVEDGSGNQFAHESFEARSDADLPHRVELQLVRVAGRVRRGDAPIAAAVWFGGRNGEQHVGAQSGEDGRFETTLPRGGRWDVEVQQEDRAVTKAAVTVQPDESGRAEVDLRLPGTRVSGIVENEKRQPVGGATVFFHGSLRTVTRSDAAGRFVFRGVPPGPARISAALGRAERTRSTNEVRLNVEEDRESGPVELVLQPTQRLIGQVSSLRGPVAGATVMIEALAASPPFGTLVTSDIEGGFEADLPADVPSVVAVVSPPGFALKAFEFPLDGRTVVLHVAEGGGLLRVRLAENGDGQARTIILQDGKTLQLATLTRWALSQGVRLSLDGTLLEVPNMAAGVYRACVLRKAEAGAAPARDCQEGSLNPGGTLELDLAR